MLLIKILLERKVQLKLIPLSCAIDFAAPLGYNNLASINCSRKVLQMRTIVQFTRYIYIFFLLGLIKKTVNHSEAFPSIIV